MSLPADYHMHSWLCRHGVGEPREYAACALRQGLAEIGFSEHAPMPRDDFDHWRMFASQLDDYVDFVRQAQKEYPQLSIKLGLEIDYIPGFEDWIQDLASRYPWDYLIGSVHYVADGWAVDNPEEIEQWTARDPVEVWNAYFARLSQAVALGLFDIIGHADLPKKFGNQLPPECESACQTFLEQVRKHRVLLELNTAGLRKVCREIYPGPDLLRRAFALNIPITFGSDAHQPAEVGFGFAEAVQLARRIGYTCYGRLTQRQREWITLTDG